MATGSNTGFYYDDMGSALNWHAISFQSGAVVSSMPEMVPMGNYFGLNNNTCGMMHSGNSSIITNVSSPMISQPGNASGSSLLLDSVPGLKHDAGLAVEWSVDEQYKLEEGLVQYSDEPSMMRYIKIAAKLHDKTVRDVALRCRWMTRKRRKSEERMVKKVNIRKDKPVELSSKQYLQSTLTPSMTTYSCISNHMDKNQGMLCNDVSGVCGPVRQLLEQNAQAFSQISANLSTFKIEKCTQLMLMKDLIVEKLSICDIVPGYRRKLQDNIDLFGQTRHNINTILDDMRKMPGIMSRMPPLTVSINNDLATSILPKNET